MIFGHSLAECRKTVMAFAIFGASGVALFVAYDPGIKDALMVLLGNAFAVAAVFAAPKFSIEDLSKMLGQLSGSVFTLIAFFAKVDPSLPVTVGSIIALVPIGYAIWKTKNVSPINMELPPVVFGRPPPIVVGDISDSTVTVAKLAEDALTAAKIDPGPPVPSPPPPGPPDPPVPPASRPVE